TSEICRRVSALMFFFSSRRRHTRFSRDWSSDVCSSDLMPLQHSERRQDQQRSVELFEQLHATGEGAVKELLKGFLDYAREHREIVERFGRFPHRNGVLKRPSTEAEIAYLNEGAPRYGQ